MNDIIRRIGVIGLGRMGLPMARHLLNAGFEVAGFDLNAARRASLAEAGGSAAASAREIAAYSQAVLVMVTDDAQVKAVTLEPAGVLPRLPPGAVVIIASTVKPSTCATIATTAAARGIGVLYAPVAKGQRSAEAGDLNRVRWR
jgi:3-hydroxyisobutyrate dehydrogenase-like beta-hydroxyacid dehydrogenase